MNCKVRMKFFKISHMRMRGGYRGMWLKYISTYTATYIFKEIKFTKWKFQLTLSSSRVIKKPIEGMCTFTLGVKA